MPASDSARKEIPEPTIQAIYALAKDVVDGKIIRAEGIRQAMQRHDMSRSSAGDYITFLKKLLGGGVYWRISTVYATDYFLTCIKRDFGPDALRRAIAAVRKHLKYAAAKLNASQPGVTSVVKKHSMLAKGGGGVERADLNAKAKELDEEKAFDPNDAEDARQRLLRSIALRQGQPQFRAKLLEIYGERCAISGCSTKEVLEASHIIGYQGPKTNHPANGLLLRADLHTLFDRGLIGIDTKSMTVLVSSALRGTDYERQFAGKKLRMSKDRAKQPNHAALNLHRQQWKL